MRLTVPTLIALVLLLSIPLSAPAQPQGVIERASQVPDSFLHPQPQEERLPLFEPPFPVQSLRPRCLWSADVLVGLPTGVRLQRVLSEEADRAWLVEGFFGLEVIFPMVGGGIRRRLVSWSGECDSLCFSPGVDAYYLHNSFRHGGGLFGGGPDGFGFVTVDTDMHWKHAWTQRFEGDVGLKVGLGLVLGNEDRWAIFPVLSVYLGCHF